MVKQNSKKVKEYKYTVLREISRARFLCLCDCGKEFELIKSQLKGNITSCGCVQFSRYNEDLVGRVFGEAEAIKKLEKDNWGNYQYLCRCIACGKEFITKSNKLKRGHTTSCGCKRIRVMQELMTTHGLSDSSFYKSYHHMIERCYNPKTKDFDNWGGRGISVCPRWKESFENFKTDMLETWAPGLTIERKDVDGNYEPSNCTWIPKGDQAKNTRNVVRVWVNGEEACLSDVVRLLNPTLPPAQAASRLRSGLWSLGEAVIIPQGYNRVMLKYVKSKIKQFNNKDQAPDASGSLGV